MLRAHGGKIYPQSTLVEYVEFFLVAAIVILGLRAYFVQPFKIPTGSMQPTLMGDTVAGVYDRILVDKILPLIREPKRWDITVFKYPLQKNQNYVKRIDGPNGLVYQHEDAGTQVLDPEVAEVLDRKHVSGKTLIAMDTEELTLERIKAAGIMM